MNWPSPAQVFKTHDQMIARYGGHPGVSNHAKVVMALELPMVAFEGREIYSTIVEKVGVLVYELSTLHPFVDGNKRTAWAVGAATLAWNDIALDASLSEKRTMNFNLARGMLERDDVIRWFMQKTQ